MFVLICIFIQNKKTCEIIIAQEALSDVFDKASENEKGLMKKVEDKLKGYDVEIMGI